MNSLSVLVLSVLAVFSDAQFMSGLRFGENVGNNPNGDLLNRLHQAESMVTRLDGKLTNVLNSLSRAMTQMTKDTSVTKTVVNRLVEDSVKIQGEMRILKDVGNDVSGLRSHVNMVEHDVTAKMTGVENSIHKVSNDLAQQARANRLVSVQMRSQMRDNKGLLATIRDSMSSQDMRIRGLESKLEKATRSQETIDLLEGKVAEMEETLQGVQNDMKTRRFS